MRPIRIGVVEDDPAACQLILDYLNRYQREQGEQFVVSAFNDGAALVEHYTPVYDILLSPALAGAAMALSCVSVALSSLRLSSRF